MTRMKPNDPKKPIKKDSTDRLAGLTRNLNIGRVLAFISQDFPFGGVDNEGDGETGETRFWAKASSGVEPVHVEISNELLNSTELDNDDVAGLTQSRWRRPELQRR